MMRREVLITLLALLIGLAASAPSSAASGPRSTDKSARQPLAPAQAAAFEQAMRHFNRKEYAQAVPYFDEAIRLQPGFAVALAQRGFAHLELGEFAEGISDHDAVLRLASDSPNAFSNSCWARAAAGADLDLALDLCNRSLEMQPSVAGFDMRGFVHFRRGDFREAIKDYDASIRIRSSGSSYFMRGVCKARLGQADQSLADIRIAMKKDSGVRDQYRRLGVEAPA